MSERYTTPSYHIDIYPEFRFDDKKYKTHQFKLLSERYHLTFPKFKYYKCNICGLEVAIHERIILKNDVYAKDNYSCDEFVIKNIIE